MATNGEVPGRPVARRLSGASKAEAELRSQNRRTWVADACGRESPDSEDPRNPRPEFTGGSRKPGSPPDPAAGRKQEAGSPDARMLPVHSDGKRPYFGGRRDPDSEFTGEQRNPPHTRLLRSPQPGSRVHWRGAQPASHPTSSQPAAHPIHQLGSWQCTGSAGVRLLGSS
jgi:hypothetical protein